MSSRGQRHDYAERVVDDAAAHDAGRVNGGMPRDRTADGGAAAVNTPAASKTNEELIAEAAAKLDITEEDVIIAVMGLTGVGKSTFIKLLSDSEIVIGHTLDSCTVNVAVHQFYLNDGRRAYLVDTPGFDDGKRAEAEILEEVSNFFAATYSMNITLAGVIYLHRISDNRMSGAMFKNLRMLKKLCGRNCYSKIVLATTMWDRITDTQQAVRNEQQLGNTHEWWGDLKEDGATIMRQDDGANSAMRIVEHIMSFSEPAVMENQIERVDRNLALQDCESGKVIAEELIKQREEHERVMQEKREEHEEQIRQGNVKAAARLERLEERHREQTEEMNRSQAILARRFEESNEQLQRQIQAHNSEMAEARSARARADAALQASTNELAGLRAEQARRERQWEDARLTDKREFEERMKAERNNYAAKEAEMNARVDKAVAAAEASRSKVSKGIGAVVAGVAMTVAGAATLNPALAAAGVAMAAGGGGRAVYKATR